MILFYLFIYLSLMEVAKNLEGFICKRRVRKSLHCHAKNLFNPLPLELCLYMRAHASVCLCGFTRSHNSYILCNKMSYILDFLGF